MSRFSEFWGDKVSGQEKYSKKHEYLFGSAPKCDAIMSHDEFERAVVYDGEAWRELDLNAIQGKPSKP